MFDDYKFEENDSNNSSENEIVFTLLWSIWNFFI